MTTLNRRLLCEELHAEYAELAANKFRARVLRTLADEKYLLKFVIEFIRIHEDGESCQL